MELEEKPASGSLSFKVYANTESTKAITDKTAQLAFAGYTSIKKINLQWNLATKGSIKVKSANLIKQNNSTEPCNLEVFWGCYLNDFNYATGIEDITITPVRHDDGIIGLSGVVLISTDNPAFLPFRIFNDDIQCCRITKEH